MAASKPVYDTLTSIYSDARRDFMVCAAGFPEVETMDKLVNMAQDLVAAKSAVDKYVGEPVLIITRSNHIEIQEGTDA